MISINMLIQFNKNQKDVERVVYIDENNQHCFLVNIYDNSYPVVYGFNDIDVSLKGGEAVIINNDPFAILITEEDISPKAKHAQMVAWDVVSKLLKAGETVLLNSSERNSVIHSVAIEMGINEKTVANYLKRYWKRGMNSLALLPDFKKRGGKGHEKKSSEKKRGRPRKSQEMLGNGVNVDEEVKKIFRLAAKKYYENKKNVSVQFVYEQMIKEFFRDDLNQSPEQLVTYEQFLYWLRKEQNLSQEIIRRTGKRNYDLNFRPVLGSSINEVRSPGEKIQIDATVADVYLVSDFNREWIIGRPVLYLCKCVWSSMIVAFHVGLEGPNFEQARLALLNMVEDKVEYCKLFDIDIEEAEWPTAYLPNSIIADRAELLSYNSNLLTEKLNVRLENTGSWRGDLKSLIERQFGLLTNEVVKPMLPGAVDKDFGKRGTRDHRLSGKLTLREFQQIIMRYIIYFNNHYVLEGFVRDEEMIKEGVEPIPVKLWEWGMKNRAGRLRTISKELMMLHMLPKGTATISESGIRFRNMLYSTDLALKEQWFVKARFNRTWKIDVVYDPRNATRIYIPNSGGHKYEVCHLLKHQSRYKNKSMEEISFLQEFEKQHKGKQKQMQLKAKVDLQDEIQKIVKEAEKQSKINGVMESDHKRIKDIRVHRKFEQEYIQQQENVKTEITKYKESQSKVIPMSSSVNDEDFLLLKSMQQKKGREKGER